VLLRLEARDGDALVTAVNESREHLAPWMPWAQTPATTASIRAFLSDATSKWRSREEFGYVIRHGTTNDVVGGCGLHPRQGPGVLEIGYWVHVAHTRHGIATAVAAALTNEALALEEVERVEIRCDVANVPSAAVPKRLGFRFDRTEHRTPQAPGETGELMVWARERTARQASR
jgi:RimJ/RimL family protein N-acetyltransferase